MADDQDAPRRVPINSASAGAAVVTVEYSIAVDDQWPDTQQMAGLVAIC